MSVSVTMPRLGESVSEGTVTRWLKKEGERVEADEPLLEVSTDKVDTEIPSPASGVLGQIKVAEDETVDVGVELAVIHDAGGSAGDAGGASAQDQDATAGPDAQHSSAAAAQPAPASAPEPVPTNRQPAARADEQPAQPVSAAVSTGGLPSTAEPSRPQASVQPQTSVQPKVSVQPSTAAGADGAATGEPDVDQSVYVTPLVRKLAGEHNVDLATVSGTGVGGRVRKQDVLEAAAAAEERARQEAARQEAGRKEGAPREAQHAAKSAPASTPSPAAAALRGKTEKLSRLRTIMAHRMVESLQVSAQLTTVVEVDVTRIARLRQQAKAQFEVTHGAKLSFLPFFALATVEALRQHPKLNASMDIEAGTVTYHDVENLGIAVDTERGLMAPVIKDAGDLNLGGMARKISELAARTRGNKVGPDDLVNGTFTLTNTGSRGALFDTPILFQPQVGILGTGAVVKRAVVVDDPQLGEVVVPRSMVYLALSYDHRLVDGADAARFLITIKDRLEGGSFEADLGLL